MLSASAVPTGNAMGAGRQRAQAPGLLQPPQCQRRVPPAAARMAPCWSRGPGARPANVCLACELIAAATKPAALARCGTGSCGNLFLAFRQRRSGRRARICAGAVFGTVRGPGCHGQSFRRADPGHRLGPGSGAAGFLTLNTSWGHPAPCLGQLGNPRQPTGNHAPGAIS